MQNSNADSAENYAELAYQEANALRYVHGMAVALARRGSMQTYFHSDFAGGERLDRAAIALFEQTANKNGLASTYCHLAFACFTQAKYDEALRHSNEGYLLYSKSKDTAEMVEIMNLVTQIYLKRGEFENGFNAQQTARQMSLQIHDSTAFKETLLGFGTLCMGIEDYPMALSYYQSYFQHFTQADSMRLLASEDLVWARMEYAEIYSHLGRWDSALRLYDRFDTTAAQEKDLRIFLVSKGEYYMLSGQYEKALPYLTRGLATHLRLNDGNEIVRAVLDIAETYSGLHEGRMALRFTRQGLELGLQSRARQRIRDAYKLLYTIYDSRGKMDSAYFYYRRYIQTKESLSDDQTKGRFAANAYLGRIEALNNEKLINEQRLKIQDQQLKKESLIRYILITIVLVILLVSCLILRNVYLKRKNEILKTENIRREFQQKSAEMEMQALRAQMNPHFIFNCLNSINRFIIKNEPQAASDYLTQFSRLIRLVLNNSKKTWISLEDEMDTLRLYLDMEKLRFKDAFDYGIVCADGVDPMGLFIPPLLIQPFVENAVWHGLMHKKGNGMVTLSFSVENDILHCTITDNGVGRSMEARAGGKSPQPHRSMGIQITRERLELINSGLKEEVIFNIEDLTDESGAASGTKVNLSIKFRRNYEPETEAFSS